MSKELTLDDLLQLVHQDNTATRTQAQDVFELYKCPPVKEICGILNLCEQSIDLGDGFALRFLSIDEILNPAENFGTDYSEIGIIPLIDTFNNDFLVYNVNERMFQMYNISEDIDFEDFDSIVEFIESRRMS